MDATIKMMLQTYIDGLDSMNPGDEALRREAADFKNELLAFGETQNDVVTFFANFQNSGLQGKYVDITSKISMAAMARAQESAPVEEKKEQSKIEQWLEPFHTAYDHIKDLPVRERGLAVYRRLFEIGERNTDITEFLLEVEEENLLWKLSSEDTLGILQITLTGMDPLYRGLTYSVLGNIEAWKRSVCEADAFYLQDIFSRDNAGCPSRLIQPQTYVACLGAHLMVYRGPKGKEGLMTMLATGRYTQEEFRTNAGNMVLARLQARRTEGIIKKALGLGFDDILHDEFLKYWLISTANVCGLSKAYVQSNSVLLDILADAFHNEIMTDISLLDAFRREPSVKFGRWRMPDDAEHARAVALARERFKDLPYFKYEDQLNGSGFHVGMGEGFDIKPLEGIKG